MSKRKKRSGKVEALTSYINLAVATLNLILVLILIIERMTG